MPRAVITGGAGFVGSHLAERFLAEGWDVLVLDSLLTGEEDNLAGCYQDPRFRFERYDVTNYLHVDGPVDWLLHLASPASPVDYLDHPIHTMKVNALGSLRGLGFAKARGCGFLLASTSEAYGDPQVHPQPESYWGNVNPIGPRGVYDEAKRFAEALTMAYHRAHGIPVRIIRIFNTYGPRMRRNDGRAVPTFIRQALRGDPITVHGDGGQTRSLCYVTDLVDGIWRMVAHDTVGPVNLGNPEEVTIAELAKRIREIVGSRSELTFTDRPVDDPEVRCPDIALARSALGWEPTIGLAEGLEATVAWARTAWAEAEQTA